MQASKPKLWFSTHTRLVASGAALAPMLAAASEAMAAQRLNVVVTFISFAPLCIDR
jgi:hypothetical protein